MRRTEIETRVKDPWMKVIPEACNHIIVSSRSGNVIDVMCSLSSEDDIFIITKNGNRIIIDGNGTPTIEERLV